MHPIFRRDVLSLIIVQIFGLLTLVLFGTYFGILLTDLTESIKFSALILGLVFASRNIVQIFIRVPLSELSQTIGRKPLIIAGTFCYTLSLGILYLATHWVHVFIATIIVGFGMSMHWPAVFSYIGDIAGEEYGRINGIIFQGQDVGILGGALLASYLLNNNIVKLGGLFAVSFSIGLFGVVLSILILPEILDDENRIRVDSKLRAGWQSFVNTFSSLKTLSRRSTLGLIFLLELLITFTEFFFASFFPLLMVFSFEFADGDVAKLILYSTLSTILFKQYFGKIFDKFGFKSPILIGLALCGVIFYAMTYTTNFWMLMILYTIALSAIFICYIASTGATSNTVVPGERGLAMGVLGVYISSGRALSSVALAPVLAVFDRTTGSRADALIELFRFVSYLILTGVLLTALYIRRQSNNKAFKEHNLSDYAILPQHD